LLHWSLEKIPFAFVSGLLYGYLYYKTGKLIYPILAHSFNNLLGTFLTYTPHYMNLETAVTLFVAVACFVVSLRYVVRFCSKAEAASTAGVNEEATKEL
jgi:membrane protease YdiL (CAAX protease family)